MSDAYVPEPEPEKKNVRMNFTQEEDEQVRKLVELYNSDWAKIASQIEGRNERQCKDRWDNYLDPSLNKSEWTPEEDKMILEAVEEYGRKWSKIYILFKGRSSTSIKNRYNVLERHRIKEERRKKFEGIEMPKLLMNRYRKSKKIIQQPKDELQLDVKAPEAEQVISIEDTFSKVFDTFDEQTFVDFVETDFWF